MLNHNLETGEMNILSELQLNSPKSESNVHINEFFQRVGYTESNLEEAIWENRILMKVRGNEASGLFG